MIKEKHQCAAPVWCGNCSRNATIFEDNECWCKQHSPSEVKRRTEARQKKKDDEDEGETAYQFQMAILDFDLE